MNPTDRTPLFIDCEASGLGEASYPIEIAVAALMGPTQRWLIDPTTVSGWTHWSRESEGVHGYNRYDLIDWGEDGCDVAEQLFFLIDGRILLSDNPDADQRWITKLFNDTQIKHPIFEVHDATQQIKRLMSVAEPDPADRDERLYNLKLWARALHLPAHRAQPDAEYLRRMYQLATQLAGEALKSHQLDVGHGDHSGVANSGVATH